MTPDEAFDFVNRLCLRKSKKGLNDCERAIVIGLWKKKTYEQIYDETYVVSVGHLRNTASGLFKKIKEVTELTVYAKNFKTTIESLAALNLGQNLRRDEIAEIEQDASQSANPFVPRNGVIDRAEYFFNREPQLKAIFEDLNSGRVTFLKVSLLA